MDKKRKGIAALVILTALILAQSMPVHRDKALSVAENAEKNELLQPIDRMPVKNTNGDGESGAAGDSYDGCDYEALVCAMSEDSYRKTVEVSEDTFVVVRRETESTTGIEDTQWYRECDVKAWEVLSKRGSGDGSRVVTYALETEDSQGIWEKIDACNSSKECLIAEPVYAYHLCDVEEVHDDEGNTAYSADIDAAAANPNMSEEWYLEDQGIPELNHDNSLNGKVSGKDIVVAVLDTGVDYTHEDLADNMWINEAEQNGVAGVDDDGNGVADDIYGASFDDESATPMDENGHGTHVAGIIAMSDNAVGGIGLASHVKIMAVKAAGSDGVFQSTDVAKAIRYASEMGADVINMSFGAYAHSAVVEEAIQEAYGTSILVAAAGNEGYPTADSPVTAKGNQYPACYTYVLGVMAHDEDYRLASFSNWDYLTGEGPEYEIAAPGVNMYSTLPGNQYGMKSGTSMAAAVVSAAAAVVKGNLPVGANGSSRYVMEQILAASGRAVGGYRRVCLKDCYEYMAALNAEDGEESAAAGLQAAEAGQEMGEDAENAGSQTTEAGQEMEEGAENAGSQVADAEQEMGEDAGSAGSQTAEAGRVILESKITANMTLESGGYYIIDKGVTVEEGVTVNVEPGARLQFWNGDPKKASTKEPFAYIEVQGTMNFKGTEGNPIELFPDKNFGSYRVEICNTGTVNMDYVSIVNPYISISTGKHLRLTQDYDTINYRGRDDNGKLHMYKGSALVEADTIEYSTVSNLRYTDEAVSKAVICGACDTVQFDNCRVNVDAITAKNCVFLINCARIQNAAGRLEYAEMEIMANITVEEATYPAVSDIYILDSYGRNTDIVSGGQMEVHVLFNRNMDRSVLPEVSYGVDDPYTDHRVQGEFVSEREWVGTSCTTGQIDGAEIYFRIKGAVAANDTWLVTGTDWGRFHFIVDSSAAGGNAHAEHRWEDERVVVQEPACTETGYSVIRCAECDEVKDVEEIPALGHDYGEWVIVREAFLAEEGLEQRVCTRCGETEQRSFGMDEDGIQKAERDEGDDDIPETEQQPAMGDSGEGKEGSKEETTVIIPEEESQPDTGDRGEGKEEGKTDIIPETESQPGIGDREEGKEETTIIIPEEESQPDTGDRGESKEEDKTVMIPEEESQPDTGDGGEGKEEGKTDIIPETELQPGIGDREEGKEETTIIIPEEESQPDTGDGEESREERKTDIIPETESPPDTVDRGERIDDKESDIGSAPPENESQSDKGSSEGAAFSETAPQPDTVVNDDSKGEVRETNTPVKTEPQPDIAAKGEDKGDGQADVTEKADPVQPFLSREQEQINILAINEALKIAQKGSRLSVKWGRVSNADGYQVYVAYYGKKFAKPTKTIRSNRVTSVSISRLNGGKLNLKKKYKVYIEAYKVVDGKKQRIAKSITGYAAGRKNATYTNVKKLTVGKSRYTIQIGQKTDIKAGMILVDKNKKALSGHSIRTFRYASSDEKVATVDTKGRIKGVGAGKCTIYVYAANGCTQKVKVVVK